MAGARGCERERLPCAPMAARLREKVWALVYAGVQDSACLVAAIADVETDTMCNTTVDDWTRRSKKARSKSRAL